VTVPRIDAVVLADGPQARVLGLSLGERARRVCARLGTRRVLVVDRTVGRAAVRAWWRDAGGAGLLLVRARDQLIHMPLLEPLLAGEGECRVAVGPDGAYAGALLAEGLAADRLAATIAGDGDGADPVDDAVIAAGWLEAGAARIVHGPVARHPATTPAERKAAGRFLEQIVHKPQDGPVTRYAFRTVSVPITRLLLRTPIAPNHISLLVAALGIVGVYFTAQRSYDSVILGAGIMLAANYLDGCDGEIARLKLKTSRLGAWMDTVTDELSQLFFMAALGYHNYLVFEHPVWLWATAVGVLSFLLSIAGIYYMLITVLGTANSQDYVGSTEIRIRDDGTAVVVPRPPVERVKAERPRWLQALIDLGPHIVRRDFVNLGAFAFAIAHINWLSFSTIVLGGVISAFVIVPSHFAVRRRQREAAAINAARGSWRPLGGAGPDRT
jgi:phosphatidylglycerophosphate synthase